MRNLAMRSRFLMIVVLLAVLWSGQVDYARADHCAAGVPQWAGDRQQHEPGYVYASLARSAQPIPQWARDRQQYETNYVYVPQALDVALLATHC